MNANQELNQRALEAQEAVERKRLQRFLSVRRWTCRDCGAVFRYDELHRCALVSAGPTEGAS
jgi:predicted Zn-ribbon and HTH transcriptional regulator